MADPYVRHLALILGSPLSGLRGLLRRRHAGAVLAAALFIFAVDRACGLFISGDDGFQSLVLPPVETVRYEFRDFQFTVSTNRLGFRGPEFPIRPTPGVKRILVFGNSFTYGWGVDFEDTWPRLLERELNGAGLHVEIANVARAGTTALEMKDIAARSIPLLKPDLVIISALQGGALTTLQAGVEPDPIRERPKNVRGILLNALSYAVPNYVQLLQVVRQRAAGERFKSPSVIQREQKKVADNVIAQFSAEERRRFDALDPASTERFTTGTLNLGIVTMALGNPDFWVDTVKSPKMIEDGLSGMHLAFSSVKAIAEKNGASVIVASMPYGAYLGGTAAQNLRRLGFNIPDFLNGDQTTEDQIRRAAADSGVTFVTILVAFQADHGDNLFIPFDGHYSAAGTRLYAKLLSKELLRLPPLLAHETTGKAPAQN